MITNTSDMYSLSSKLPNATERAIPIIQNESHKILANFVSLENKQIMAANKDNEEQQDHKDIDPYLSIEVIQQILNKFLTEAGMTKEGLAKALDISVISLKSLLRKEALYLIPKINLPLCELFCCETKFNWLKNI